MTASRFQQCLAETVDIEGGYSNRSRAADPGGATMCGITWKTYNAYRDLKRLPRQDVRESTREERAEIYYLGYWVPSRAQDMPAGVDLCAFDFSVNSGPVTAVKKLQRALGEREDGHLGPVTLQAIQSAHKPTLIVRYMTERKAYCETLPNYWANKNGWANRWARVEQAALYAAGESDWAADVIVAPEIPDLDRRSAAQGRATADDPRPPAGPEVGLQLGSGGGIGFEFWQALSNAFARVRVREFTSEAVARAGLDAATALLSSPMFWMCVAGLVTSFYYRHWRKAHAR
jgi:lysozyme family protein